MHIAAFNGQLEVVRLLLDAGADKDPWFLNCFLGPPKSAHETWVHIEFRNRPGARPALENVAANVPLMCH